MSPKTPGNLLHALLLDRNGGAVALEPENIGNWRPDDGLLWLHIDVAENPPREWMQDALGLESVVVEALAADETRPRSLSVGDGLLTVLRGVNMNPGDDPEDMVSIRLWIEHDRIVSTRRRKLLSVQDLRDYLEQGIGPQTSGEFLSELIGRLADRIGGFVDTIEDKLSSIEEAASDDPAQVRRRSLAVLRRQIASVRRFVAPQRDALDRLYRNPGKLLSDPETNRLREEADRVTRYLEDLDLARERAVVLQEELMNELAQLQNTRMYVLSVVAAIFLPLTFVTGLLGMNVGGLPGVESPRGFLVALGVMAGASAAMLAYFRYRKWL
jgi:zinc transporter